MGTLFKLKAWLTLDDAARRLSILFDEQVTVADVLRLALDGHLTLSMNFVNHAQANLGKVVPFKDVPLMKLPPMRSDGTPGSEPFDFPDGMLIEDVESIDEDTRFVHFSHAGTTISGVWDLVMQGGESIDIESRYQELTGGPSVELVNMQGTFVKRSDDEWARVLHQLPDRVVETPNGKKTIHGEYYSGSGLPADGVLVIRTSALREFERKSMDDGSLQNAPFFDADSPDYPALLHIAVRAWEHARSESQGTPKQRVLCYLATRYASMPHASREAIAQVVNWQRAGGRPAKKSETGG